MGRHATQGRSLVGHKNTALKQGAKHEANARVYNAASMASEVTVEYMPVMDMPELPRKSPFTGINPVYGQDFTKTGTNTYKLRVRDNEGRDCYIGITRQTVKPKDGKAFGVWIASYAGYKFPLLANKGQALGFADAKSKLMQVLIADLSVSRPARVFAADKVVKAAKAYTGGMIEMLVCQITLEPARVCDCGHHNH
jgi:hypothetical protein